MTLYSKNSQLNKLSIGGGSAVSSHWTTSLAGQWFILCLVGVAVFHWVISGFLPPTEDELYYWTWSQKLQWSYYDHPLAVALLIKLSTGIFGNSVFGIRFFCSLIHFLIFWMIGTLVSEKKVLLLALFTPMSLFGAVLMTPDVPFLLFWTLYFLWLVNLSKSFAPWGDDPVSRVYRPSPVHWETWFLGGLLLGLGILSKYSMILAAPCTFLVLVTAYRWKSWGRGFIIHLIVASIFVLPILLFNQKYHFAPLKFQWGHSISEGSGVFLEFLGGQIALVGLLPLLMLGWVLLRRSDICSNPVFKVCFYCFVFPFLFSLFQSAKAHVEANWAMMSYIAFWPLAQFLLSQNSIAILEYLLLGLGFIPPLLISILVAIHLVYPIKWVPAEKDRLAKYRAIEQLSKEVKQDLILNDRLGTLYLPTYQLTSYFRFLGVKSEQLFPLGRPSNFTLEPAEPCIESHVIILSDVADPKYESLNCFTSSQQLKVYPLVVRGKELSRFYLMEYYR